MWSLLFMNPNTYIVAILADRRCFFSEKWGGFFTAAVNLGTSTTFPRVKCAQPQSNKPVSALHKLIDLQALMETELRKQTSKLLMWRNERNDSYRGNYISDCLLDIKLDTQLSPLCPAGSRRKPPCSCQSAGSESACIIHKLLLNFCFNLLY